MLPVLTIGLVVRYEYLWARRTADKDAAASVVAAYRTDGAPEDFVVYLPISHSLPRGGETGVELASQAKTAAGLDAARQWVIISECNIDAWPYDLRPMPGQPDRFHYGHLPPASFRSARDQFVALFRSKAVKPLARPRP